VNVLNFLAGLATIVLAMELLVLVFLVAAVCGGIWFGLRFAEKKADPALDKVNSYIDQARGYERMGLRMAVKPLIILHAFGEMVGVTVTSLVNRAREAK